MSKISYGRHDENFNYLNYTFTDSPELVRLPVKEMINLFLYMLTNIRLFQDMSS